MIRRLDEAGRAQFLNAVRGCPYFGDVLPIHLAVFGESHALMRFFFASPAAAIQVRGQSALLCGSYDPEEVGAFLRMQGIRRVNLPARSAPPAGYRPIKTLYELALRQMFCAPPAPALPGLALDRAPPPSEITDFLMCGETDFSARDNFYSELCAKLNRGAAEVWAVRQNGALAATAGAYALSPDHAYLAAVETAEHLRGHGIGGWLTGMLAKRFVESGRRVTLTCAENRIHFYERLGFARESEVVRYTNTAICVE